MKAWIIVKFRQDSGMQVPGSYKIVEGHETQEIANFARDSLIAQITESEKRVGWTYKIEPTEIHMSPTATATGPIVD